MVDPKLHVSVVYALPNELFQRRLSLASGSTVADAIVSSGLAKAHPHACTKPLHCGIFSRPVTPETPLRDGDRVEVYRPLQIDPKAARRQRAQG